MSASISTRRCGTVMCCASECSSPLLSVFVFSGRFWGRLRLMRCRWGSLLAADGGLENVFAPRRGVALCTLDEQCCGGGRWSQGLHIGGRWDGCIDA